jgi:hypothetical protein
MISGERRRGKGKFDGKEEETWILGSYWTYEEHRLLQRMMHYDTFR